VDFADVFPAIRRQIIEEDTRNLPYVFNPCNPVSGVIGSQDQVEKMSVQILSKGILIFPELPAQFILPD
jgi:hypothetical protein